MMQSIEKPARLKKADVTQLNHFLKDVASNHRGKVALATKRGHSAEMPLAARNSQESDSEEWSDVEDDDDDDYSTIDSEFDYDDTLEEYAEMLLEYKENMKEEDEWIQEMERRLIGEVSESLRTLRACQLAVQSHKAPTKGSERDEQRRKSSAEMVLAQRRSSAAQVRTQSAKAAKKVRRVKARELKARKALVQALKKQHEQGRGKAASVKSKNSQWHDERKKVQQEFEKDLQGFKQMLNN